MKKIVLLGIFITAVIFTYLFINKDIFPEKSSFIPPIPIFEKPAKKMSAGQIPNINFSLPDGLSVRVFASGINQARDMVFTPGGILPVSDPSQFGVCASG